MSALSNIAPQAVLPLQSYDHSALRLAAVDVGQRVLQADCSDATDPDSVLARIVTGFALSANKVLSHEELYREVTGLPLDPAAESPGFIVFLENLPEIPTFDREARNRLLDVFREAADYFYDRQTPFRVFYSVRRTP